MPPRRNIRDENWERLRFTIRKLYLKEDRSLKDVLLILGTFHGFYPSKSQLEWKLKQWHLTKNMGIMDWKYVGHEIHRRKCRGKESKVYLSGIPLRMKAIERGVSRYCHETAIEKAMRYVPEPPMPEDQPLLVCTPAPQEMSWPCRLDNIPWLLSRRLVEGLALKVPSHMSISYRSSGSSQEGLVESILFPTFNLQSYTTLLMQTFAKLRSIMPEEYEGAHAIRAQGLLQKAKSNTVDSELLACLVFLLSNGFFDGQCNDEQQEVITATMRLLLCLFRESGSNILAEGQYSRLLPSLQSSLDSLFREAIKASDLGAVSLLLQAGVDINMSFFFPLGSGNGILGTALQHASTSNQPELLKMLLNSGADPRDISIHTITSAWLFRKVAKGSPEETMKTLLSVYQFLSQDEHDAVRLLFRISYTLGTPVTEALIDFFRTSFADSSPAAKAQLLITAIRTNSHFVDCLISDFRDHINSCGYYPETPMTAAVYKCDTHLCQRLLQLGATLESGHKAATPLQWAASFSNVSIIQQLLDWGSDVNFCHPFPTLLRVHFEDATSMCCYSQSMDNDSDDPTTSNGLIGSLGRTALQAALLAGNKSTAKHLLTAGAKLVGGELVMAIWTRHFELIGALLDRGATFQDECIIFDSDTVLEAAILSENTNLVYQVISADRRLVTGQALCAAVCLAKATGNCAILRYLLTYTSELLASEDLWIGTAMCLAAYLQFMEIPEMILSSGLHPETSWPFDIQRLELYDKLTQSEPSTSETSMIGSYLSWRRKLRFFFGDQQSNTGRPIMEVAVSLGQLNLDYVRLLLKYGYQPGPASSLGFLCYDRFNLDTLQHLHGLGIKMTERILVRAMFCEGGHEVIEWLLTIGVDINERSKLMESRIRHAGFRHPWTPLQSAVFHGHFDLFQRLIECGADVNETPYPHGSTSLQCAASQGFFGIVQRLLELGADPNAPGSRSPRSRTAIEAASDQGRLDIVQLLLNSGVKISDQGRKQYIRSIFWAEMSGHHAITKLLKSHGGWTEADESLLSKQEEELFPTRVRGYFHGYYDDEFESYQRALDGDVALKEDESSEGAGTLPGGYGIDGGSNNYGELTEEKCFAGDGRSETRPVLEGTCCRVQELTEELDEPSEVWSSTLAPISNLPDVYEALSEEIGLEFLPSSMSYQIREELEGNNCHEESGGDLWAEEYSKFITELV